MKNIFFAASLFFLMSAAPALAQHGGDGAGSVVAGLSEREIADLRRGAGMGFAKPAELNGAPGPAHLLELRDDIPLTVDQVTAIEKVFASMREAAVAEGARLIHGERALDAAFRDKDVDEEKLRRLLAGVEASRAALRFIHLSAHLEVRPLLSRDQIERYAVLRGYAPAAR